MIMGWFQIWWQSIGLVGQIMACAAIPMTVIMFLQLILMIIGVGFGGDSDGDGDAGGDGPDFDSEADFGGFDDGALGDGAFDDGAFGDASFDDGALGDSALGDGTFHDGAFHTSGVNDAVRHDSVRIFTVRGIVAFFALGGWAGLAALTAGIPALWSIQIALLSGAAAMLLASVVIRFALKMQSNGNIDLRNALSHEAEVYITIPPLRENKGKVTMILQERFVELDAVTDCETAIKSGGKVLVTGLAEPGCLIVRPLEGDL